MIVLNEKNWFQNWWFNNIIFIHSHIYNISIYSPFHSFEEIFLPFFGHIRPNFPDLGVINTRRFISLCKLLILVIFRLFDIDVMKFLLWNHRFCLPASYLYLASHVFRIIFAELESSEVFFSFIFIGSKSPGLVNLFFQAEISLFFMVDFVPICFKKVVFINNFFHSVCLRSTNIIFSISDKG